MYDHPEGGYSNEILVELMKDIPEEDYVYVSSTKIRLPQTDRLLANWESWRCVSGSSHDGERCHAQLLRNSASQ